MSFVCVVVVRSVCNSPGGLNLAVATKNGCTHSEGARTSHEPRTMAPPIPVNTGAYDLIGRSCPVSTIAEVNHARTRPTSVWKGTTDLTATALYICSRVPRSRCREVTRGARSCRK